MVMLREILLLCLVSICSARRLCRRHGGRCHTSLVNYPCTDPMGAVLTPSGKPLCGRNRHCCVASPGVLCFPNSRYGPKSFCMLPGSDPEYPQSCTSPTGFMPYGLHMEEGDHKCHRVVNKTRCCTVLNQCSTNPNGYCGPKYVLQNLDESCRNGYHYPEGDEACADRNAPFCCLVTKQQCGTDASCKSTCAPAYQYQIGDVLCGDSTKCCLDEPRTTPSEPTYSTTTLGAITDPSSFSSPTTTLLLSSSLTITANISSSSSYSPTSFISSSSGSLSSFSSSVDWPPSDEESYVTSMESVFESSSFISIATRTQKTTTQAVSKIPSASSSSATRVQAHASGQSSSSAKRR